MPDRRRRATDESGFTLIEVLIATLILGLIASGVASAIILFFRTTDGTSNRLALSHDSQLLATYLIPDLDSLTGVAPAGEPCLVDFGDPTHQRTCKTPTQSCGILGHLNELSFGVGSALQISFTDLNSQKLYVADYSVGLNERVITRTLSVNGEPPTQIDVVHNLKAPNEACFTAWPSAAPWTMTIGTATGPAGPGNPDYTFSVTGGGRVTPPAPPGAPQLCDQSPKCPSPGLVSRDTNNDGHIDQVVATFDQPLVQVPPNATPLHWQLVGPWPSAIRVQSVAVRGNQAVLNLSHPTTGIDTVGNGFKVALSSDPGIGNGANQDASFPATAVTDGMPPVATSIVSQDLNDAAGNPGADGKIDHVVVTFSEPLGAYSAGIGPWTLLDPPPPPTDSAVSLKSVSVSGDKATLTLNEGSILDTSPTFVFTVALAAHPNGIQDMQGNQSSFTAKAVLDGMAPAPIKIVSQDLNDAAGNPGADGKIDHVVVTFSEPLGTYSAGKGPWTISYPPTDPGISLNSVKVAGSTATLTFDEGTTYDTAATGLLVSLSPDPNGIRSAAPPGNVSSFTNKPVSDRMSPVVDRMLPTNASGGTPGKLEAGDTLTLIFSEPLATNFPPFPPNPTATLSPGTGTGDDMLAITGLATIDLGAQNTYVTKSSVTFDVTLTTPSPGVVKVSVGSYNSGTGSVLTAPPAGTTMTVTPLPQVTDLATPPNAAVPTTFNSTVLF